MSSSRPPESTSEEHYRALAESVPVQIWTSLPDGKLDFVTEQTARTFGLTAADLLRDGWKDVVHPEDLGVAVEHWTHSLSTGAPYEVEFRLKLADGSYACFLARAVPQRTADGKIVRWLGTNTNIEEQREERRRVQALLDEVVQQANASAVALKELRDANIAAYARIADLEQQLRAK
jgi:PAS domain S-box-containing protein